MRRSADVLPRHALVAIVLCAALAAAVAPPAGAQPQGCTRKATIRIATEVYDRPPTFFTAEGWKLGRVVGRVAPGQGVLVCDETEVGFFGLQRKTWLRIQTPDGAVGWIFKETTSTSAGRSDPVFALAPAAYAQGAESVAATRGVPELGTGYFYVLVFLALLLGMLAKAGFDELDEASVSLPRIARRSVKALLVSPMIALGILQGGNYGFTGILSYWISLFIAFQNGFFWQTLLRAPR